MSRLDALFEARSVAVLGASSDPLKIGGRPIKFLKVHGFAGAIHPVNPKAPEIQGLPAFPDLAAVPGPVDHAVIALPSAAVLPAVEACAARGVRSVTIFGSGFAEVDAAGRAAQERIAGIARDAGMRVLGPNCMGFMNFRTGLIASFAFMVDLGLPPLGRIALVSQSGAFGGQALVMARDKGVPLGAWVTTGNECDVELADCIAHFAADPGTDVIMGYMEGCKSGDRLVEALDLAQANGKSVIVVKAGGSAVGQAAVQSHTGALAGSDRVFDAVFERYGVHRADSVESFFDVAYAASAGRLPAGGRLGVFTVSGGIGVLSADAAEKAGLELPPLPEAAQTALQALLPHAAVRNPVDGTAQIWSDMKVFDTFLQTMARDGRFDALLLFMTAMPYSQPLQAPLKANLLRLRAAFPDMPMILSMLAPPELGREMAAAGYLLFEDTTRAIKAVAALRDLAEAKRRRHRPPPPVAAPSLADARDERAIKQVLAAAGIASPRELLARSLDEGHAACTALGFPVALKIVSPDILHKSDIGGVALGIADAAAFAAAWDRMMDRVRAAQPEARITGALVTPMLTGGVEMIVGSECDPVFGPVVMVGLGGIFAEVLGDVTLRPAPVDRDEALAMIRELKAFALLDGARGRAKADIDALADTIQRLGALAAVNRAIVQSIEINPLLVLPAGQGAVALDAVSVPRDGSHAVMDNLAPQGDRS